MGAIKLKRSFAALFSLLALAAVPLSACTGGGGEAVIPPEEEEKFDLEYVAALGETDLTKGVSPLIYGEFLEHITGCIYGVIWSELLEDRKFYYPAGERDLSPWQVSGGVENTENGYSSQGYSPKLTDGAAIFQTVNFLERDYAGYFYAEGKGRISVDVGGDIKKFDIDGGFKKYTFSAESAAEGEREVRFECTAGEVKLDSLSLMPADNYKGMRRDTLDAMKELAGTVYRWPGGNFVSGYDWKDGVGDRDKRPSRRNLAWFPDKGDIQADKDRLKTVNFYDMIEPNDMGTEEFLAMCEYIGAIPYLAVNTGSGTAEAAADYVDYCNGSADTEYGAKRVENGRAQPYGVKYWCVGNEMQGDWQIGHMPVDKYVSVHNAFVDAMRSADDMIVVTGCGDNFSDWTEGMFASCAERLDFIGEHLYIERDESFTTDKFITSAVNNFEYRINAHRQLTAQYPAAKHVKIAFDEYAYNWNGQPSMPDAMGIAATLNLFIENADVVGMANYSDAVFRYDCKTSPGAIYSYADGLEFTAVGRVLQAYARNMLEFPKSVTIRQTDRTTNLQYCATAAADGKTVALAVANPSDKIIKINVRGTEGAEITKTEIAGTGEKMPNGSAERAEVTVIEKARSVTVKPETVNVFVFQLR